MPIGTINFPTSLDDLDTLIRAANNAITTLSGAITAGAATIPLTSAAAFPNSGIAAIIDNPASPTLIEIFTYTGKSSNDLTGVLRGQEGTTGSAFSAGATVVMRPTARHHSTLVNAIIELQKKVGYSASVFRPLDPVGTNQPGNNLDITGGPGTGNAAPGIFGVRYPLIGASGTALQALSANRYPPAVNLYTSINSVVISNTTVETSIFTGLTGSAGSTNTIEAGITRAGTVYRVKIFGSLATTGTPTLRVKAKLGSTVIADTGVVTMTTVDGRFWLTVDIEVTAVGAAGSVNAWLRLDNSSVNTGAATMTSLVAANVAAIDFTTAQPIDITFQWGTASTLNIMSMNGGVNIDRAR